MFKSGTGWTVTQVEVVTKDGPGDGVGSGLTWVRLQGPESDRGEILVQVPTGGELPAIGSKASFSLTASYTPATGS